jgi:hypothetical protein
MPSCTTTRILDTLQSAGLTVTLRPGPKVGVTPADRLTGELRDLIRDNKTALLDWLQAANDPGEGGDDPARWCWPAVQDLDAPMNHDEVETFTARVLLFMRRGMGASRAEALADRLKRRDREGDDRRACIECRCLTSSLHCPAWRKAGISGPQVGGDLLNALQRCPSYQDQGRKP